MSKIKRVTKKRLSEWIENNTILVPTTGKGLEEAPDSYVSKIDGSYITFKGLEENLKFLIKRGINQIQSYDGNTACLGFNEDEQKWYGWSHRAIYGFGIGSECKKGSFGFKPSNKEDFKEDCLRFWGDTDMDGDTHKTNPTAREEFQDGKLGIYVEYTYDDKVPNEKMRGQIGGVFTEYPEKWGKGEWVAKTIEDAKEMAIDFAKGVS